jgi:predicted nucleic acid-binding protein
LTIGLEDILLDTNVVSEMVKPRPNPDVLSFLSSAVDPWLSSVTIEELVYGAERAPDPKRRAKLLGWIGKIKADFVGRMMPIDDAVAERSGRLRALAAAQGRPATVVDSLIAASAQARGLTLVTRNTTDFETFGIKLFNPWTENV